MRFFTMAWWRGMQETEPDLDPIPAYAARLAAIRDRLPAVVLAFAETVSLHDAQFRSVQLSCSGAAMLLTLASYAGDERFVLSYTGVERFDINADLLDGFPSPAGFGDLGYDELDLLPTDAFQHRMLFSSGIEIAIDFRGFDIQRTKTA